MIFHDLEQYVSSPFFIFILIFGIEHGYNYLMVLKYTVKFKNCTVYMQYK